MSDHVAKFQGDRSSDLGERVAKKRKKNIWGKTHKPVRNWRSGRPNKSTTTTNTETQTVHCVSKNKARTYYAS